MKRRLTNNGWTDGYNIVDTPRTVEISEIHVLFKLKSLLWWAYNASLIPDVFFICFAHDGLNKCTFVLLNIWNIWYFLFLAEGWCFISFKIRSVRLNKTSKQVFVCNLCLVWSLDSHPTVATHAWSPQKHMQTKTARARRRQAGLMKYGSLEFKGSTVGVVKGRPRDGDVSRSFMTLE